MTLPKPTILHVIDSLVKGGAETLLVGVVNSLSDYNHVIVTMNPHNDFEHINATIICLNYRSKLDLIRSIRELKIIINEHNIGLVHSHLLTSTFVTRMALPKGLKLIFSVHNLLSQSSFKISRLSWLLEKITYGKNQEMIFVSNESLKDYDNSIGIKGQYQVLHNYVEDDYFKDNLISIRDLGKGKVRLVAVGSLKRQKNYEFLIRALTKLDIDFHLDIYGDGPLKSNIERTIRDCEMEDKISLRGSGYVIHDVLRSYDVYIMCSLYEGFGIAPVEAMALGIPVVLSDIPVLREVAAEGAQYFKVNDEGDFISCLNNLISDKEKRKELSLKGRKRAEEIGRKEHYLNKLQAIYNSHLEHYK